MPETRCEEKLSDSIVVRRMRSCDWPVVGHLSRALGILGALLQTHRRSRLDIVHLCHVYHMGLGAVLFRLIFRVPMVDSLLGWDTYDPITPLRKRTYPYLAFVMNHADVVITMSTHMVHSAYAQGCAKEIEVIPHGTSVRNEPATLSIREKHGLAEHCRILFSLQRLEPRKQPHMLLDAVGQIRQPAESTVLIIGGRGTLEEELRSRSRELGVEDHVVFAGYIPDHELPSYYEQADVFVLSTLYEAFGLVYVDALSKGLPIVTTAVGGALDIVDTQCGILVPPSDCVALAKALEEALARTWDRRAIRERGAQYDWDRIVRMYENVYQRLGNLL